MRHLGTLALLTLVFFAAASGCKRTESKPAHREPWLAHPPGSPSASPDAALSATRYVLTNESRVHFELSSRQGKVRGTLTRVTGELDVMLGALAQSRARIRAELGSLTLDDPTLSAAWLTRVQSALGAADEGDAGGHAMATFDVSALDEVSPEALAPAPPDDAGARRARKARAIAAGDLLLNGFRVAKRAPIEAEFDFLGDPSVPGRLSIRSRTPLVISLETHEIHWSEPAGKLPERRHAPISGHDVRVTIELYAMKP